MPDIHSWSENRTMLARAILAPSGDVYYLELELSVVHCLN